MKRRTIKKRRIAEADNLLKMRFRDLDRHDRAYLHVFLRGVIHSLAREDLGVDTKVQVIAGLARRLAPAIGRERRATRRHGEGEP